MRDMPLSRVIALGVIILLAFYFLFFKPKNTQLKTLKAERVKVEDEVNNLRAKKNVLNKIEAEMLVLNKTLTALEAIIPQKKETDDILSQIQQLASNSHLNVDKFIPKGEIDRNYYYEWQISLELTGNYHNLATFFDRLSRSARLFTIENFSIRSLPRQTAASTISATGIAKTYIFREEAAIQQQEKEAKGKKGK